MRDCDIRAALKQELASWCQADPRALILDELGLAHGAARADVVAVGTNLHGFEIKSDQDTLERLPEQVKTYSAVFDQVTLVVAYGHAYEAMQLIPDWWGVRLVEVTSSGTVLISEARDPSDNPAPDPLAIAMLLWRDEALALLDEYGASEGVRSKPRSEVYARVAETVDLEQIRARVRRQLRCRPDWRSGATRTRGGG